MFLEEDDFSLSLKSEKHGLCHVGIAYQSSFVSFFFFYFFFFFFYRQKKPRKCEVCVGAPPLKAGVCRSRTKKTAFPWKLSDFFFSLYVAMYNDLYIKINASRIINDKTIENDSIRNTLYIIYIEKCRRAICLSLTLFLSLHHSLTLSFRLFLSLYTTRSSTGDFKSVYWSLATLLEIWLKESEGFSVCACNFPVHFNLSNLEKCSPGLGWGSPEEPRFAFFKFGIAKRVHPLFLSLNSLSVSKVELLTAR